MVSPELLRRYPFFGALSEAHLRSIAMLADEVELEKDAVVFEAGQKATALYLLIQGGIDLHYVVLDPDVPGSRKDFYVGEVDPGEPFGISALLEPFEYTTAAVAAKPTRALKIEAAGLRALCELDPNITAILMRQIAKAVMARLHATRIQLAAAQA